MTTAPPIASTIPIVCTLGAGEYADRLARIAKLNRSSLRSHQRDGLTLVLDYAAAVVSDVRELVAREQACCAFLAFRTDETPHGARLSITAPAEAADALDAVFAPFLAGVDS